MVLNINYMWLHLSQPVYTLFKPGIHHSTSELLRNNLYIGKTNYGLSPTCVISGKHPEKCIPVLLTLSGILACKLRQRPHWSAYGDRAVMNVEDKSNMRRNASVKG